VSASAARLAETAVLLEAESLRRATALALIDAGVPVLRVRDDLFLVRGETEPTLAAMGWLRDDALGEGAYVHPLGGLARFSRSLGIQGVRQRSARRLSDELWADAERSAEGWLVPDAASSARSASLDGHARSGSLREALALRREGYGLTGLPRASVRFRGLYLSVPRGVYPPKPVTEKIAGRALDAIAGIESPTVIDVGSGCGAVAISIARARPDADVYGVDTSSRAIRALKSNARRARVRIDAVRGSLLQPLDGSTTADAICANVPYVPPCRASDPAYGAPRSCVAGSDPDGLGLVRELVRTARGKLRKDGTLILQVGEPQWDTVSSMLEDAGYSPADPDERPPGFAVVGSARWMGSP